MRIGARGFSLVEVLLALTIGSLAVAALGHVAAVSTVANRNARFTTLASLLARQKMEQLRALAWTFDVDGEPVTDPAGLSPSPDDSLARNVAGYCDFLDGGGHWLASGIAPPSAVYTRRWNVAPLDAAPDRTVVVQVAVFVYPRQAPLARIVAVRTRKVP